jgi:P27 family predicted phage terminase small subunit
MNIRQPRYAQIYKHDADMALNAKELWATVIAHLQENGIATKARLKTADRYVRAHVEYDNLYPIAAAEGPVKEGPNGGDVFNFNWSVCEKLNDRLGKFEDALLISPKAASDKLAPKSPDRKATAADEFIG